MVPLPIDDGTYNLRISNTDCAGIATARLTDKQNQFVTNTEVIYTASNNQGQIVFDGNAKTDDLGLVKNTQTDKTVATIEFLYNNNVTATATIPVCKPLNIPAVIRRAAETPAVPVTAAAATTALTVLALAASTLPATFSFANLFSLLLNYLLTVFAPKRDRYGIVFDATTQKPVPRTIVQLYNTKSSRVVATALTDKKGHYIFNASKGEYTLAVRKDGFVFPSKLFTSKNLVDRFYLGQKITISENNPAVNYLIPIDPVANASYSTSFIRRLIQSGSLRYTTIAVGTGFAIYALVLKGSLMNYIVLTTFLIIWIVEYASMHRFVRHSSVIDAATNKPLGLALVRTANSNGKLVETFVSDQFGRVLPQVNAIDQQLIIDKSGYKRETLKAGGTGLIEKKKFVMIKNI